MRSLRYVLLLLFFAAPWQASATPVDEVKNSFNTYKTAILASDGPTAAQVVTQESRDYFRKLADQALKLDSDGLHKIYLSDRLYALLLRHSLQRAQLESMSGREVVSYAVKEGWIGKEGAEQLQLGDYKVDGDHASGSILRPDGEATPFKMEFVMEDGHWLLDLVALMKLTRSAFDSAVHQSGLSEDEFVMMMLEYSTGRKPSPDIWSPPQ